MLAGQAGSTWNLITCSNDEGNEKNGVEDVGHDCVSCSMRDWDRVGMRNICGLCVETCLSGQFLTGML